MIQNAERFGGDASRIAVMGESAGGNLAANVAIMARDEGEPALLAWVLVYPIAGNDINTLGCREDAAAKSLSKPMMEWFVRHVFDDPSRTADPRINLVAADPTDLPPATIIAAQIDPLRTEGQLLARRLEEPGVEVDYHLYDGTVHGFFGMGLSSKDAAAAEAVAAAALREAFGQENMLDKAKHALG